MTLNDARIRNQLDPRYKNAICSQNPLEKCFWDRSKFDSENPSLGDLLQQVEKIAVQNMLKDAPNLDLRMSDTDI